jgi:hypothetical protein
MGPAAHPAAENLVELLDERSTLFQNRDELLLHHLRAYLLATLSDIGVPKDSMPYIIDGLANSDDRMAQVFAAAARAAAALGPEAAEVVPLLMRALEPEFVDRPVASDLSARMPHPKGPNTSPRFEAIKALQSMGSAAAEALPLLRKIAEEPAHREDDGYFPPRREAARRAIEAISETE